MWGRLHLPHAPLRKLGNACQATPAAWHALCCSTYVRTEGALGAFIYVKGTTMNTNKREQDNLDQGNAVKDPDEWTTGEEPMTGAQRSYLKTLSDEAGEPFDETLTKAEASKKIDELQHKTGRGLSQSSH